MADWRRTIGVAVGVFGVLLLWMFAGVGEIMHIHVAQIGVKFGRFGGALGAFTKESIQIAKLGVDEATKFRAHEHVNERVEKTIRICERVRDEFYNVHKVIVRKRIVKRYAPYLYDVRGQPRQRERYRHGRD